MKKENSVTKTLPVDTQTVKSPSKKTLTDSIIDMFRKDEISGIPVIDKQIANLQGKDLKLPVEDEVRNAMENIVKPSKEMMDDVERQRVIKKYGLDKMKEPSSTLIDRIRFKEDDVMLPNKPKAFDDLIKKLGISNASPNIKNTLKSSSRLLSGIGTAAALGLSLAPSISEASEGNYKEAARGFAESFIPVESLADDDMSEGTQFLPETEEDRKYKKLKQLLGQ